MKKFILNLIILLTIIISPNVKAKEYDYTKDNANLLTETTKDYIERYSSFIKENNNFNYYVVTDKTLGVYTLEELSDSYYEQLNIGKKGILIFYVKDKQAIRIKVGENISEIINEIVITEHINKYILPFLKNQEVDNAILNGYKSLYKVVCNYYKIDSSSMEVYYADNAYEKYKSYITIFLIWVNTVTTYLICDTIKKFYSKKKKVTKKKQTTFIISTGINIFVLFISYFMNPTTMLIILVFEFVAITSSYSPSKPLDLNEIKRIEYKKELKKQAKERAREKRLEAQRLKKLKKIQKQVKLRNKKINKESSDLEKMLKRSKHK